MSKYQAVFFDFDDTLQDRAAAYRLYCEAFLDTFLPGVRGEERTRRLDEMEAHVDGGYRRREEYFPLLFSLWNWTDHPPLEALCRHFNTEFGRYVVLLPGARETLAEIKRRGYFLGLISNGVSLLQNTKLSTSGLRPLFDASFVSGDLPFAKPDRRIFDRAAERAGAPNEACLFVGDHPVNDIQGARGAGMDAVWMEYGTFQGHPTPGVPTVHSLPELLELLPQRQGPR